MRFRCGSGAGPRRAPAPKIDVTTVPEQGCAQIRHRLEGLLAEALGLFQAQGDKPQIIGPLHEQQHRLAI